MSDTVAEPGRLASQPTARAVLVVGPGRSGATDLADALRLLGLRAPVPTGGTTTTAASSPDEQSWVARFHERLLRQVDVGVADARPQAWFKTGKLATDESIRQELFAWLEAEAAEASEMVISDQRLVWFLSLWRAASLRCGVDASYAVMLRAPGALISGPPRAGAEHGSETSRAAGWINHVLHAERGTRGSRRAFVAYEDLLEDWTVPLYRLGERFGLDRVHNATAREIRRVHDLLDSRPTGLGASLADVELPQPLRVLVDEVWDQLTRLARADEEPPEVHAALDELRREYAQLYADAERIAHSTIAAQRRRPSRRRDGAASGPGGPETVPWRRLLRRRPTV